MTKTITELNTVQDPILKYASEIGWQIISREEAEKMRKTNDGLFFYEILQNALIRLNKGLKSSTDVARIIANMENLKPSIEGNAEFLKYLHGEKTYFDPDENRELNLSLIDFKTPENNSYQVTKEWYHNNGKYGTRQDVVFLINGIPIISVEAKSVTHEDGIAEGFDQVERYHRETPEIMISNQIYGITHLVSYLYSVTWNFNRNYLFFWKTEENANFEQKVKSFFEIDQVLKFIKDYIVFSYKDEKLVKMILRQHQTRAVEKVIDRAEEENKHHGLLWHTQGSGKTLTMITAAQKLMKIEKFEKPTVILLIDRNELQDQLMKNLEGFGVSDVERAMRKSHLRQLLQDDYRGIIVSMIHKFDKLPANINERRNIFVLIDEAHRTTSSNLGNYMMSALPNATYFGFTGTPIDKISYGRGTFKIFGVDDKKGYLDKYSIAESIEDGTTIPLNYSLAPNEFRVPRDILEEEFLKMAEAEAVSDIEELNKILEKAVNTKNFLKAGNRADKIAKYIAKHYKENVEPLGYKAFVVGVDREACAIYKEALDKYLPEDYSKVVYSSGHNDNEFLKKYHIDEEDEKRIRKEFPKSDTKPKILIVTEKLLTGFDAPNLYVLYLDKPMRDHTLLQAIARVNRPYEHEGVKKAYGLVVDFVGIFEDLEKALSFDSDEVGSVIHDLEKLKEKFADLIENQSEQYLSLFDGKRGDKKAESIIEYFRDEAKRKEYQEYFKEVETLYEIISPDKCMYPYISTYTQLAQIYQVIRSAFKKQVFISKQFQNKTSALVRDHVKSSITDSSLEVYEINEKTLQKLKESKTPDAVKVINLTKSISNYVQQKIDREKYLISIVERAEVVKRLFDSKQIGTQEALKKLEEIIFEINDSNKKKIEKGFNDETFFIYSLLNEHFGEYAVDLDHSATSVQKQFELHGNWRENSEEKRELKASVYKFFLKQEKYKLEDGLVNMEDITNFVEKLFEVLETT